MGYISNLKLSLPFVIGVFHGGGKPQNANDFLETFVNEANELRRNGLVFAGCRVTVHVEALICDAPARAMVAFIKSHISSLHGCGRCTGSGVNVGLLRSNENFRLQSFPDHHQLLKSYLENSEGFNMVFDLPLDPMHLIDLAVTKKLLTYYFWGAKIRKCRVPGVTLPISVVAELDNFVLLIRKYVSKLDFARAPRSVKELPRWKASELRFFLHYIGVVVSKPFLPKILYEHFLCLHVAIKMLSHKGWCYDYLGYVRNLLIFFVKSAERYYGTTFVSYNVHNLMHVTEDVKRFGPF